jgi:hypothetical protein
MNLYICEVDIIYTSRLHRAPENFPGIGKKRNSDRDTNKMFSFGGDGQSPQLIV